MPDIKTIELSSKSCKIELSSEDTQDGVGIATVKGKISEADITNANDFYISHDDWVDMLNVPINQERLKSGAMYGCVGHDERPVDNRDIRNGEVSHIIKDLWMEGNDVMCKATILDTDSGKNLLACLKGGGFMQASTRLSVKETQLASGERSLIGGESEILTIDFVIDPAIPSTYITLASKQQDNDSSLKDLEMSSLKLDTELELAKQNLKEQQELNSILKQKFNK